MDSGVRRNDEGRRKVELAGKRKSNCRAVGVRSALAGWLGALALIFFASGRAESQVALEIQTGAAVGNHAPAAAGVDKLPGPSFSVIADVRVLPRLAVYADYTYGIFYCQNGFCVGERVKLTSSGFGAGLRFSGYGPLWARAGFLYHGTGVKTMTGDHPVDAAPGYQLAAGVVLPVRTRFDFVSGLGYRSHFDSGERTSVLTIEAGARIHFGGDRAAAGQD